jgi:ATP-dependent helicase/nuclease subunit B
MLCLVTGASYAQNSRHIKREISQLAAGNEASLLIVPEQASFINERDIAKIDNCLTVSVVSFSRLAEQLLDSLGGGMPALDDTASRMLMCVALDQVRDLLHLYKNKHRQRGFIEQLSDFAGECKNFGIAPDRLSAFSDSPKLTSSLAQKTREISIILDAYEALAQVSGLSPADGLERAAFRLSQSQSLSDTCVYVDGFDGFTEPEWAMLKAILQTGKKLTVTVCCDSLASRRASFSMSLQTAARLAALARELGIEVQTDEVPPESSRPGGIAALERELDAPSLRQPGPDSPPGVYCCLAENIRDELENTARRIAVLVRREGWRYRDIAVISNNAERYHPLLPIVFSAYEIPYFIDLPKDARFSVLTGGLLEAISLAAGEGDWVRFVKSPLLGIDAALAGAMENYCFTWSVGQNRWRLPFRNHPDGLATVLGDEEKQRLKEIESLRARLAGCVERLGKALATGSAKAVAAGVYSFLDEIKAGQNLLEFASQLAGDDQTMFLEEQSMLWEQLMELLDRFAALPEDLVLDKNLIAELFELAVAGMTVSTPPRTLDSVSIGTAQRMRPENPRGVFLLGAIEGEFPAAASFSGLFSTYERRIMWKEGLQSLISDDYFENMQRAALYRAVNSAKEMVQVSCPKRELAGGALTPSLLFEAAKSVCRPHQPEPECADVCTPATLARQLALGIDGSSEHSPVFARLAQEYSRHPKISAVLGAAENKNHNISPHISKELFKTPMHLSASRLESFYRCPFMFFARHGLGIKPPERAELGNTQAGTLLHWLLSEILEHQGIEGLKNLSDGQLKALIGENIDRFIAERVDDPGSLSVRARRGFDRQKEWVFELLRRMQEEFEQSSFLPIGFEVKIGEGAAVESPKFTTPQGARLVVHGSIDRVDVARAGGAKFVRVIDYKSSEKKFSIAHVEQGLDMQMLIYLFAACSQQGLSAKDAVAAGALYMTIFGKYHTGDRMISDESLARQKDRHYRMNGIVLDDERVVSAMSKGDSGESLNGMKRHFSASMVSPEEMQRLKAVVEKMALGMAQRVRSGDIAAIPAEVGGRLQCAFCDYSNVCGFEEGERIRVITSEVSGEVDEDE